ncbi:glycosyltransferase WbsX family protein [[Clostridium] fimetarium]|uniref:Glycosyltransferase WbsX n=1 Tax=[Clostridium] fimetarium TaxID=99656 RepID=A0A1I0RLQ0_9FIRM|nr:glycoside hydrolase family 99-like domain-containing protein [[Clostridium] fimetarium]SEW41996.1 Glycosyltransferase WbsX [[Clostridium] fimetarium]
MLQNKKIIAFYLPQFHSIPENDEAYGKGFTEWTNTKKAEPLFDGHYQPKTPYGEDYYCILDDGVMEKQAKLAKENGIYGFCYYHYWFKNGKKILEKPLENMLKNPNIDIPFCMCWANENWTKRWDGGNNEVIVAQDYGDMKDLDDHIQYLCQFFKDDRYIKEDEMPILLIYKPELIPNLKKVIKRIRKKVVENGFPGIKLIVQFPTFFLEGAKLNLFDNYIQFEPIFIHLELVDRERKKYKKKIKRIMLTIGFDKLLRKIQNSKLVGNMQSARKLTHRLYDNDWDDILNYKIKDKRLIAGAFVDWDNTSRNICGVVYEGSTPDKFGKNMKRLINKVDKEYSNEFIYVNAWNEWAEGAYLEPDEKYGYAYLEALKIALEDD